MTEVLLLFSLPWLIFFCLLLCKGYYLISLWTVIRLRIGLYFLISILSGVFFLFLVVIYLEVPGIPDSLCSVHSKITWTLFPFFAIVLYLKCFYNLLFGIDFLQDSRDSFFVDDLQPTGRNVQGYPTIFLWNIKPLLGDIWIKSPFCLIDRKGNVVSKHHLFSCYFTNFRHLPNYLSDFIEAANLYHFTGTYKILFQKFKNLLCQSVFSNWQQ